MREDRRARSGHRSSLIGCSICVLCLWRVALRAIIAAGALMPIPKVVVLVLSLNRRPARRALRGESLASQAVHAFTRGPRPD